MPEKAGGSVEQNIPEKERTVNRRQLVIGGSLVAGIGAASALLGGAFRTFDANLRGYAIYGNKIEGLRRKGLDQLQSENGSLVRAIGETWGLSCEGIDMEPAMANYALNEIYRKCLLFPPKLFDPFTVGRYQRSMDLLMGDMNPKDPVKESIGPKGIRYQLGQQGYALPDGFMAIPAGRQDYAPHPGDCFIHELSHQVEMLTRLPPISTRKVRFNWYLGAYGDPEADIPDSFARNTRVLQGLLVRTLYPEYLTDYSLLNRLEDIADTCEYVIFGNPKLAWSWATGANREKRYKVWTVMKTFELLSGGRMDKQYWRDLADGRVTGLDYWAQKEPTRSVAVVRGQEAIVVTDLSKNPKNNRYIPAMIRIRTMRNEEQRLLGGVESLKGFRLAQYPDNSGAAVADYDSLAKLNADANIAGLKINIVAGRQGVTAMRQEFAVVVDGYPGTICQIEHGDSGEVTIFTDYEILTIALTTRLDTVSKQWQPYYRVINKRNLGRTEMDELGLPADFIASRDGRLWQIVVGAASAAGAARTLQILKDSFKQRQIDEELQQLEIRSVQEGVEKTSGKISRRVFLKRLGLIGIGGLLFLAGLLDLSQKPEDQYIEGINLERARSTFLKIMAGKERFPIPLDVLPWSPDNHEEIRPIFE